MSVQRTTDVAKVLLLGHAAPGSRRVALVGNPNTGKTTLFNALCGARAKTANFPGTTTAVRTGRLRGPVTPNPIDILDLPGVYGLSGDSAEIAIARAELAATAPDLIVVVIDACNLARNLVLVAQVLAEGHPAVVALNMSDLAGRRGLMIDAAALSRRLGVRVIPMSARSGIGLAALRKALPNTWRAPAQLPPRGAAVERLLTWAEQVAAEVTTADPAVVDHADRLTQHIDGVLTHPVLGVVAFVAVMAGLFWILFALAAVPMNMIEATFAGFAQLMDMWLPAGPVHDLLSEGVVGGIAGTIVFLPQICLLFFLITLLEDTGYLARAALVMERLLARFGLPGHAFVPLLTAHACAVPAVMSTRLIADRRDRLATILVAPFMSCSARLPVYVLLTTLLFPTRPVAAGVAFAGCYLLGAAAALFTGWLCGRTILPGRARPLILELPTYKVPSLRNALLAARDQGVSFLTTAGTVIVAICIVMWWLSAYPKVVPPQMNPPAMTAEAASLQSARAQQAGSFAGRIGHTIAPVFAPIGFDSQLTVGVLTSFVAREVFVSTMAVLAGGQGDAGAGAGVVARIRGMQRDDGSPVFTPSASAAALVFFVLAMQCLPTLAVTRKQTGSLRYAALQLGYMSGLAYVAALIVYQGLRAVGVA